jgi:hypothetical protein
VQCSAVCGCRLVFCVITQKVEVRPPAAGAVVPKDLTTLAYRTVLVEVQKDDNLTELHGYAHRLLANNVPVVLCGTDADQMALRQGLTASLGSNGLVTTDVALHLPSHTPGDRYRFRVLRLTILTTAPLGFRVCVAVRCVRANCFGRGGAVIVTL